MAPDVSSEEFSCLTATLVALFHPTSKLDFLLTSGNTHNKNSLHMIINLMPEIRKAPTQLGKSDKINILYKELGGNKKNKLSLDEVISKLFKETFGEPSLLSYVKGDSTFMHVIELPSSSNESHTLQDLLNCSLEENKLSSKKIPLLMFRIKKESAKMVLPNLLLTVTVDDESTQEFRLSAAICKVGEFKCTSFIRTTTNDWIEYETFSSYPLIQPHNKLNGHIKFWTNLKYFLCMDIPKPLDKLMRSVCFCIYLPTTNVSTTQSGMEQMQHNVGYSRGNSLNFDVDPSSKTGKQKGIEGDNNSCFIDSFLMSLIYNNPKLTDILFKSDEVPSTPDNNIIPHLHEISKNISNPPYFCPKLTVWNFRKEFEIYSSKVSGEMMDVDEFIGILFMKALKSPYFINYVTVNETKTGNYFHQIICALSNPAKKNIEQVSELFDRSMNFQNLRFVEAPGPLFLIKMPRSNGKLIGYEKVIPDLELDVSRFLFEDTESATTYILQAVLCIRHMHYTAYIRCLDSDVNDWLYFDSMGPTGAEVTELKGFGSALTSMNTEPGTAMCKEVNTLLQDIHLCIYIKKSNNVATTTDAQNTISETKPAQPLVQCKEPISNFPEEVQASKGVIANSQEDMSTLHLSVHNEKDTESAENDSDVNNLPAEFDESKNRIQDQPESLDDTPENDQYPDPKAEIPGTRYLQSGAIRTACIAMASKYNELERLCGKLEHQTESEITNLKSILKSILEEERYLTSEISPQYSEFVNELRLLLPLKTGYESDILTAFGSIFSRIFQEEPFFTIGTYSSTPYYSLALEDDKHSYQDNTNIQSKLDSLSQLDWKLRVPTPNVVVLKFKRSTGTETPTILFPAYKIQLDKLSTEKNFVGKLGSVICINQVTSNYYIYRREINPIFWKFFELSLDGNLLNTESLPELEGLLRSKEKELTTLDVKLREKMTSQQTKHIQRIMEQSALYIYSVFPDK